LGPRWVARLEPRRLSLMGLAATFAALLGAGLLWLAQEPAPARPVAVAAAVVSSMAAPARADEPVTPVQVASEPGSNQIAAVAAASTVVVPLIGSAVDCAARDDWACGGRGAGSALTALVTEALTPGGRSGVGAL